MMSDDEILALLYRNAPRRCLSPSYRDDPSNPWRDIPGLHVIGHLSIERPNDLTINAWTEDKSWRITVVHSIHYEEPRFIRKVHQGVDPTDDLVWLKLRT